MARVSAADPFGLVGQVLDGQFRVDQFVGEGGFSSVYRGHHLGLNEPIAIKALKLPSSLDGSLVPTFVQRFRDESRILYRLSQGNLHIVRSIAAGATHSPRTGTLVPYMVLEWLEGRSLQSNFNVRRTASLTGRSLDEVIRLFDTAADGLAYAHAQGVVHRDINPGNLFLADTQQGVKMKVLDFGVAKLMHDGALDMGPRQQTVGQLRIFAPAYGAPEQFDDRYGAVGAPSDVYAFALILLEALRDRCVNEGTHIGEFAHIACTPHPRPTPRSVGVDVSDEVEAVFARATALDPSVRWPSAGEFWNNLKAASRLARRESSSRESTQLAAGADKTLVRTMPLGSTTPGPRPAPRPRTPTTIGISPPGVAAAVEPPRHAVGAHETIESSSTGAASRRRRGRHRVNLGACANARNAAHARVQRSARACAWDASDRSRGDAVRRASTASSASSAVRRNTHDDALRAHAATRCGVGGGTAPGGCGRRHDRDGGARPSDLRAPQSAAGNDDDREHPAPVRGAESAERPRTSEPGYRPRVGRAG